MDAYPELLGKAPKATPRGSLIMPFHVGHASILLLGGIAADITVPIVMPRRGIPHFFVFSLFLSLNIKSLVKISMALYSI